MKPFWTTFSKGIFWLNEHRKFLFSKSADFVIFSDITNKMADASDILYISTALIFALKKKSKPTQNQKGKNVEKVNPF